MLWADLRPESLRLDYLQVILYRAFPASPETYMVPGSETTIPIIIPAGITVGLEVSAKSVTCGIVLSEFGSI